MKVLFVLALATLATTAQASSYNVDCSNADASVRTARGHNANFVQITERNWNTGEDTAIRDEEGGLFSLEEVKGTDLSNEESQGECRGGYQGYMRKTVQAQEVAITKVDGSLFSKNTLGVTSDLRQVKTILICKTLISSISPCKK